MLSRESKNRGFHKMKKIRSYGKKLTTQNKEL